MYMYFNRTVTIVEHDVSHVANSCEGTIISCDQNLLCTNTQSSMELIDNVYRRGQINMVKTVKFHNILV